MRAQAALLESEDVARASLDAALLGTWRHDLGTNELVLDVRAAQHHGLAGGRATLQEMLAHVHPEDVHRVRAALERVSPATDVGRYTLEYRTLLQDGRTFWIAMQANLRHQGAGQGRGAITHFGTTQDITDRRQAAQALEEANSRLREADQRKNDFLAALSHELRNPLSPIRSSVFLLERTAPTDDRTRRALAVIDRQAGHMARLVDDLLDVTRMSRGKIRLQRKVIDVTALARETAEDHLDVFFAAGVALAREIAASPVWVEADATRIAQIIGNLLGNAAKFTPRGGRTALSVRAEGAWAVIEVADSGAGMSRETLAHLFEPFSQAAQTLDRSRGGLGLGLALVRGLAELHGGSVHARSAGEGHGSQLTVRLPLAAAPGVQAASGGDHQRPLNALRVLIIEDNMDAADTMREVMGLIDHDVVAVAHDGVRGVEAARVYQPDVVLCDIGLPELDGFGVAQALRADPDEHVRSAFLVALSGYALPEDIAKATAAGFDAHMAKPADLSVLQRLLSDAAPRMRKAKG